uniref:L,D-TPase catalytic domain-containing protein n=1 Tax=Rhodopseudomonas palustris (strain BisA53) TaxID=316055 RepID=Q07UN2_RHOP5
MKFTLPDAAGKGAAPSVRPTRPAIVRSPGTTLSLIRVRPAAGNPSRGWLSAGGQTFPVALGRGGIRANKREGDGGTPRGRFRPLKLWWRADRAPRPATKLPVRAIGAGDAWCEDPADRRYNQPIRLEPGEAGDRLRRDDQLYDFIIEIDHNTRPRVAGRGSAVFLHLAREHFGPTAGCVAMRKSAMLRLLARIGPRTRIVIY